MPLTNLGRKIKKNFIQEYGEKQGEKLFYMWERKNKGVTEKKNKEVAKKTTKSGKPTKYSTKKGGVKAKY